MTERRFLSGPFSNRFAEFARAASSVPTKKNKAAEDARPTPLAQMLRPPGPGLPRLRGDAPARPPGPGRRRASPPHRRHFPQLEGLLCQAPLPGRGHGRQPPGNGGAARRPGGHHAAQPAPDHHHLLGRTQGRGRGGHDQPPVHGKRACASALGRGLRVSGGPGPPLAPHRAPAGPAAHKEIHRHHHPGLPVLPPDLALRTQGPAGQATPRGPLGRPHCPALEAAC